MSDHRTIGIAETWAADREIDIDQSIRGATRAKRAAQEGRRNVGDLSGVTMAQLNCLFDACETAAAAWQGHENQPRAYFRDERDDAGDPEHGAGVAAVMSREFSRIWHMQEAIVEEVCRRAIPDDASYDAVNDAQMAAKILTAWVYSSGRDADLHCRILALMTPKQVTQATVQ